MGLTTLPVATTEIMSGMTETANSRSKTPDKDYNCNKCYYKLLYHKP